MEDLIKAFNIFMKYTQVKYPTHCEHDVLYVDVNPELVSNEDKILLKKLGFIPSIEDGFEDMFLSFKYGSC
jgi:DNA-binding protein YbaB